MSTLFWTLEVIFLTGYLVLEGFDFGVGMSLIRGPAEARDRQARTISPLFLGNEVWLVAAIGLLVGAFPAVESTQAPRLYLLIVGILCGWLIRDAGLWFRRRADRDWCDRAVAVGSVVLAFCWGYLLTDIAQDGSAVLRPLPFVGGIVAVGLAFLHGQAFLRNAWYAAITGTVIAAAAMTALLLNRPDTAAGNATLNLLAAFVVPALPFLIAVQVLLWRACRGNASRRGFF
jgi:cytochrome bd-type quinol oxidase subunit 2